MAKRLYIDTSAYLCVLLGESSHAAVAAEIAGAELYSSVLLVLEATRSLIRLARDRVLSPAELQESLARLEKDLRSFQMRDLTLDLCSDRTMPVVSTPRSLDLAHLRTALWFHGKRPLTRFVTMDESQREAAAELELPV